MKTLGWTAAAVLLASLTACGGGDTTPVATTPPPVVTLAGPGIYNVDYVQFNGVYAFLPDGSFHGLHFLGTGDLVGHPHGPLSASNSVNARETIAWANFVDDRTGVGAQERGGVFGRSFTATGVNVSISGSMGTFTATAIGQRKLFARSPLTIYDNPIAMSVLTGTYQGFVRTVGINQPGEEVNGFRIEPNGTFAVTLKECTYTGTLVQHGSTGIFDLQASTSGAACTMSPSLKGIVMPLSMPNNVPQLSFLLDNADNTKTAVFIVTKG